MDPGTILSVAAGLKRLGVRPLKWIRERREKKRADQRDQAAAAGGEFLYEDEEPTMKLKGKLTYASIATLVIGLVAELAGVDMAPTEIDAIVTAVATIGAIYGRYRATQAEQKA